MDGALSTSSVALHLNPIPRGRSWPDRREWGDRAVRARNYLDYHVRMARRQPSVPVTGQFAVGDPADEIVRVADSLSADMIVMSTHGSVGLERLLLGSVTEAVVRRAHCSVLVVRSKDRAPKRT